MDSVNGGTCRGQAADVASGGGSGSNADTDDVLDAFYSFAEYLQYLQREWSRGGRLQSGRRRAGSSLRTG